MEFLERHPQSHGLADLVLDFALAHPLGEMLELPEFFLLGRMIPNPNVCFPHWSI